MKIAIAQLNPTVGDIAGNLERLKRAVAEIPIGDADLLITPELYLCGYPPRDLLNFRWFLDQLQNAIASLKQLSASRPDLALLVGTVRRNGKGTGKGLYNSALLFDRGELVFHQDKQLLPTYDVFDEHRYFDAGDVGQVFNLRGVTLGITICEDAWNDPDFEKTHEYDLNPVETLAQAGAYLLINLSASPYHRGKETGRYERFAFHARKWNLPFLFVAQVGANDDLIFDGQSFSVDANGGLISQLEPFAEEVKIVDTTATGKGSVFASLPSIEGVRRALVLGIRDYLRKCGFKAVVLGLSGGIDSAVTACLAVDALGAENVLGVTMPSVYSSEGSISDSITLAMNLGIRCETVPIGPIFDAFRSSLNPLFAGMPEDITEENLQARIRGSILMAASNKFGSMVLTTGNKSELAVGYCTLYGDMNGGLAAISDLPKTVVYELAHWFNRERELIPDAILTKAPSAELKPEQADQDTLPPYEILDDILEKYMEEGMSAEEIRAAGHKPDTVQWVIRAVDRNEYKRKQAAPGLRVTSKAFGTGRRMPVAGRWNAN